MADSITFVLTNRESVMVGAAVKLLAAQLVESGAPSASDYVGLYEKLADQGNAQFPEDYSG